VLGQVIAVISWFAIVFTGKLPESFANLQCLWMRYELRTYTFALFMREEYPPFAFGMTPNDDGADTRTQIQFRPDLTDRNRVTVGFRLILVIPHVIVLVFLWIAVAVCWLIALFAILFTGRYPRSLFDFILGVMRWTWRVGFYSYSALGTDRYPPFTLGPALDYPARLDVEYPAELSRGLVLIKWWLLVIPHAIIVGIFIGGWGWGAGSHDSRWAGSGGLVWVLVVIAGFGLLFTGRYLSGIFDFVLGMDRWTARVAAYVLLMRDEYPPFRLDQGGREPAGMSGPSAATEAVRSD
jgi:hypothetical protein